VCLMPHLQEHVLAHEGMCDPHGRSFEYRASCVYFLITIFALLNLHLRFIRNDIFIYEYE
jgi:hypothetical protein